jgi:hypothetical protein
MTYRTELGVYYNLFFLGEEVHGVASQKTTGCLLMLFFGSLEQELLGEICLRTMETGRTFTDVFVDGETKVSGKT